MRLFTTSAISVVVPAVDAYVYSDLQSQIPPDIYTAVPTLDGLRAGTFRLVRLDYVKGLVTFPSFHTAGAVLFIWAMWPLSYLRFAAITLDTSADLIDQVCIKEVLPPERE